MLGLAFQRDSPIGKELLHTWILKTTALELNQLTSFLNGIKKDIATIENAFTLPFSNGLAKGSVNKLKTIRRVMYGRSSFELLQNKLYYYWNPLNSTKSGKNHFDAYCKINLYKPFV